MEFFEGTLNGVDAVIVQSGIGKVNAGICTQILVDLFGGHTYYQHRRGQVPWMRRLISEILWYRQMCASMTWM